MAALQFHAAHHPLHLLGDLVAPQVVVEGTVGPVATVVGDRVGPLSVHFGDHGLLLFLRGKKYSHQSTSHQNKHCSCFYKSTDFSLIQNVFIQRSPSACFQKRFSLNEVLLVLDFLFFVCVCLSRL